MGWGAPNTWEQKNGWWHLGAAPAPSTVFDTVNQTNITFSNGNLTVTNFDNHNCDAFSVGTTTPSQKVYVECTFGQNNSINVGFTNNHLISGDRFGGAATSPGTRGAILFVTGYKCGDSADNNTTLLPSTPVSGDKVDLALDTGAGKFWVRVNNGAWNPSQGGTQNPATGQGGVSVSPVSGPWHFFFGSADANDTITARFASTSWVNAAPAGFTQFPQLAASYTGPGDIVSGASAWWGLRAYSLASVGAKAVNIIRASDSTTADFYTLPDGTIDLTSIAHFLNATTGKVVTLYDQTGNGNDITQATGANQPAYTTSGGLGSLPLVHFSNASGTNLNGVQNLAGAGSSVQPNSISMVYLSTNNGGAGGGSIFWSFGLQAEEPAANQIALYASGTPEAATATNNAFHAVQGVYNDPSGSSIYVDGTSTAANGVGTNGAGSTHTPQLGIWQFNQPGSAFDGYMGEFGIWANATDFSNVGGVDKRSAMNSNQHAYWGF